MGTGTQRMDTPPTAPPASPSRHPAQHQRWRWLPGPGVKPGGPSLVNTVGPVGPAEEGTHTWRRSCCLGRLGEVRQDIGERDAHCAPAVGAGEAAGRRGHGAEGAVPLRGPLLLGKGRLPGQGQALALQDGAVVAAVSRRHREKAVGQETIVGSCCCPRGAGGLGHSVRIG